MFRKIIAILLATSAFCLDIPCKEGKVISTRYIRDPDFMVGNWSYVYHFRNGGSDSGETEDNNTTYGAENCPQIQIVPLAQDFVEKKLSKCGKDMPLRWEGAKLKFTAPLMAIEDGIIFMGGNEVWLVVDCDKKIAFEVKAVSDDVMVMVNPVEHVSEMLARKPLKASELYCLAHNVDVAADMDGVVMCY